jgi:hypothetical protein
MCVCGCVCQGVLSFTESASDVYVYVYGGTRYTVHQSTFLKLNDHLIKPLNAQKFGLNESLITIIVRSNEHLINIYAHA